MGERAHRIGQTKPVRVMRLVTKKTVEERIVSRAQKKIIMSSLVAEKQTSRNGDEEEDDDIDDELDDKKEISHELEEEDDGGNALSKQDVLSMLKGGMSSIYNTGDTDEQITEDELDIILGRKEASKEEMDRLTLKASTSATSLNSEEENGSTTANLEKGGNSSKDETDLFETALALEEVNVRELDGVIVQKKRGRQSSSDIHNLTDENIVTGKRQRVDRVVMVSSKGSGLTGVKAIPMLAAHMKDDDDDEKVSKTITSTGRTREWKHCRNCMICKEYGGPTAAEIREEKEREEQERREAEEKEQEEAAKKKGKGKGKGKKGKGAPPKKGKNKKSAEEENLEETPPVKVPLTDEEYGAKFMTCIYCPNSFHVKCLSDFGYYNEINDIAYADMRSICFHHSCCMCKRGTAAAGGMLFRCLECPRAFCEDCVEQDSIECLGRNKIYESEYGYRTKQGYYIRCHMCLTEQNSEGSSDNEDGDGDEEGDEGEDLEMEDLEGDDADPTPEED